MVSLENPVRIVGISHNMAVPGDLEVTGNLVKSRRSREALHVHLSSHCHICCAATREFSVSCAELEVGHSVLVSLSWTYTVPWMWLVFLDTVAVHPHDSCCVTLWRPVDNHASIDSASIA